MERTPGGPEPRRTVVGGPSDPRDRVPSSEEIAAATPAWGACALVVRIGSLAVRLSGLDARLERLVGGVYAGFLAPDADAEAAGAAACIDLRRAPVAHWLHLPRGEGRSEEARVGARSTADGLELWSYFFATGLDREGTRARVQLCEAADADVEQAIENILRFFVATAAVRQGGFLLHSAGILRDGKAYLFFGPSGAGKTTTAANALPHAVLLGDDLVLVEPSGDGYRACGVPFRGSFRGPENASASGPIAMACRIFHAPENRLEQASRIVQVAELLGEVPFLLDDAVLQARASERVMRFVERVPVRRLHLKRDASYLALL